MTKKILISFFNLPRIYKQFIFLVIDLFCSLCATLVSIIISYNTIYPNIDRLDLTLLIFYSITFIPFFVSFGYYKSIFRFNGLETLIRIISLYSIFYIFYFILIISSNFYNLPISYSFLYPIIFLFSLLITRILPPLILSYIDINRSPTIVYFDKISDIEKIFKNYKENIKVFMTDDHNHVGNKINNIDIIGIDDLAKFLEYKNAKTLIICKQIDVEIRSTLIKIALNKGLSLKYYDLKKHIEKPFFHISDLISRNIKWDKEKISKTIENKIILVTGGGGSIGSELSRQILSYNPKQLIILDNNEYNLFKIQNEIKEKNINHSSKTNIIFKLISINDKNNLENLFIKFKPQIIFHAAAYKHVPLLEENYMSAIQNNFISSINIIKLSLKYSVSKFIYISSDKAVRPANIMGLTKRLSEMYIQANFEENLNKNLEMYIVRFGNVAGSSGSVIPIFQNQILEGGPVTLTHKDTSRYFMTISEAVGLILEVNTYKPTNNIYILNMGEPIKIMDLAKKLILLSGQSFYLDSDVNKKGIKIEIIGLRPGEKLHEELVYSENLTATENHNIFTEEINKLNVENINEIIKKIEKIEKNISYTDLSNIISNYKIK